MMAVCPEHPMWGQNPIFTPLRETTSIPTPFICGVHPPGCMPWRRTTQISLPYLRSGRGKDENLSLSPLENVLADQEMLGLPEHAKYGKSELRAHGEKRALWLARATWAGETKAEWKLGTISPECIVLIKFRRKKMNFWRYFAVKLRV